MIGDFMIEYLLCINLFDDSMQIEDRRTRRLAPNETPGPWSVYDFVCTSTTL